MVRSFFWKSAVFILLLSFAGSIHSPAQDWLPGYNFRKKISINKSQVPGPANLADFPILVQLEDADLKFLYNCGHSSPNDKGPDISFASAGASSVALNFQLDHYDVFRGKLSCWVRIPELITGANPGRNEIYLYYGAVQLHDPFSATGQGTWPAAYQQVLHLNFDEAPAKSKSANHSPAKDARGSSGMGISNFLPAKTGSGIVFNQSSDVLFAAPDTNTTICITGWIKPAEIGTEQVILANDSLGNGYSLSLNSSGRLVFETMSFGGRNSSTSVHALTAGIWYHMAVVFKKGLKKMYLNGVYTGGGGGTGIKLGRGGVLFIGRSRQNDRNFRGMVDELRLQNNEPGADWLVTAYRNQENPESFIQVFPKEVNPLQTIVANEFTGAAGTEYWTDAGNWSNGVVPGDDANVRVKNGKRVKLSAGYGFKVNQLVLEPATQLLLEGNLVVNCMTAIAVGASVLLDEGAGLTLNHHLLNNGSIGLIRDRGRLVFGGYLPVQTVSGTGTCTVSHLEINQSGSTQTVLLQSKISVSDRLELIRGTLNANGNLDLILGSENKTASLMPVLQSANTNITGNVNVRRFVDGNFLPPSTARGWWLHASPVYHSTRNGIPEYNLSAIQASVFVTGAGGSANGFDVSPKNGATIYTHNQALPGSLSQKYVAIPNMGTSVDLGKGFYVFSRGERHASNAYREQIQGPVFSNPQSYLITYLGKLYIGDLTVGLSNRNSGGEGDGFNLLGNPYASAIQWGKLEKTNVGPFVWMFDPKNNAYQVSDDPGYRIDSGAGFFVKVNSGSTGGSLTFNEQAKYVETVVSGRQMSVPRNGNGPGETVTETRLKIALSKDGISDNYSVVFRAGGNDEVDDADAPKIGEGYLGISGLTTKGAKLSIEERKAVTAGREVRLFVKGWTGTGYLLNVRGTFDPAERVTLTDRYLNTSKLITESDNVYHFSIDSEIPATSGAQRFSLIFQQKADEIGAIDKSIVVYPNPFIGAFYLRSARLTFRNLSVVLRDVTGRSVCQCKIALLEPALPFLLPCSELAPGIYFLRLTNEKGQLIGSFKAIKNQ